VAPAAIIELSTIMPPVLTDNEFRLLAYVRGYADHREQHLDPHWVQMHLGFSSGQMREASNGNPRSRNPRLLKSAQPSPFGYPDLR
jgi:hypothetical protein